MRQRVFFSVATGRVVQSISGPEFIVEMQPVPDGCADTWVEANEAITSDWVIRGGRHVYEPRRPDDPGLSWRVVRSRRDSLIAASDWVMLPDVTLSDERRQAWMAYRQALRDITNQPDPTKIVWPEAPK